MDSDFHVIEDSRQAGSDFCMIYCRDMDLDVFDTSLINKSENHYTCQLSETNSIINNEDFVVSLAYCFILY